VLGFPMLPKEDAVFMARVRHVDFQMDPAKYNY
jgi:hypothetical protein